MLLVIERLTKSAAYLRLLVISACKYDDKCVSIWWLDLCIMNSCDKFRPLFMKQSFKMHLNVLRTKCDCRRDTPPLLGLIYEGVMGVCLSLQLADLHISSSFSQYIPDPTVLDLLPNFIVWSQPWPNDHIMWNLPNSATSIMVESHANCRNGSFLANLLLLYTFTSYGHELYAYI